MMDRRRALMMEQGGGGLPSEYQRCLWVASNGSQYINAGLAQANKLPGKIEIGFYIKSESTYSSAICGIGLVNGGTWTEGIIGKGNLGIRVNNTNIYTESGSLINKYCEATATFDTNSCKVEGTISGVAYSKNVSASPSSWSNKPFILWQNQGNGTARGRIYYARLYQQGNLLYDFVPCYRKADGVIGMYDLINKVFKTNAGSGTFTKGADV